MVNFVDSHCHLFNEYFDDIKNVIDEATLCGVNKFISAGCNYQSSLEVLDHSRKYSNYYCAVGIHPEEINDNYIEEVKKLEELLKSEEVVAIGEIGLDYYYDKTNKKDQIKLFESQLVLAEKYNLPVIVHSRDAINDTYNCLKKYNVKGVIHSFSGSVEMAKLFIKKGFYLGVNGVITFKNCKLKDIYSEIGLDHIILETDSPYLTPEPFRGKQNSPKQINQIADFICEYYHVEKEDLARITNDNIRAIFDI